jgi:hypothetical protein
MALTDEITKIIADLANDLRMPLELIDWSERYPNESSREIAIRQSTLCLCGRGKEIGRKRCWRCENAAKVSYGALPEVSRASHYS